jgi:hypothetical protein
VPVRRDGEPARVSMTNLGDVGGLWWGDGNVWEYGEFGNGG